MEIQAFGTMDEYTKSKEFHKVLRAVWDSFLKPLGFKRCKVSVAAYYRPRHDSKGFLRFWAQVSRWGDSWSGNSFTLNIDTCIDDPHQSLGNSSRFLGDLSLEKLAEAEKITQEVFARKPKPEPNHWIYNAMAEGAEDQKLWRSAFEKAFIYYPGALMRSHDIWFEYFSVGDVKRWGEFLAPLLPELLYKQEKT